MVREFQELFSPFHTIRYANSMTVPSITKPNLKLTFMTNSTVDSSITLTTASGGLFVQGKIIRLGNFYSTSNCQWNCDQQDSASYI